MATSFGSTTLVFDTQTQSTNFKENGNELLSVEPYSIDTSVLDALSEQDRQQILLSTCMSSRGAWASEFVQYLCSQAKVECLAFLYGDNAPSLRWKLPLGIEDGEEEIYAYAYGYLLETEEMKAAALAIDTLFDWSLKNIELLSQDDQLGYFAYSEEIYEAITQPIASPNPLLDEEVAYSDDGNGPWYLYSWLNSVRCVIHTALSCKKNVFHASEVPL